MELFSPVRFLKGVGEAREKALARLGVVTLEDVLFFFPRRYEDRRDVTPFSRLTEGRVASVVAEVIATEENFSGRGVRIISSTLSDGKDSTPLRAVWFNMPRLKDALTSGVRVALYGKVERKNGLQLTSPEIEILDESDPESVGRIVPIYQATSGLSQKWVRRIVGTALDSHLSEALDFIPQKICQRHGLPELKPSIMEMHRPQGRESWFRARTRLAFDELFILQVGLLLRKNERAFQQSQTPDARKKTSPKTEKKFSLFQTSLPFALTSAQERVIGEIGADMASGRPMNRLLQGDVGSGKTAVAVSAIVMAADAGLQSAFAAPTEILAQQHYFRLSPWLAKFGIGVKLLTGSLSAKEKNAAALAAKSGSAALIIGTHAIFSPNVTFNNLGLVVIDEQHRFGVLQKNTLLSKTDFPHVLVMSATPIPRTLTLSLYGDLDVSTLDELPPGRKPVKTVISRPDQTLGILTLIRDATRQGRQVYWVCPLIEEGEKMKKQDLSAAASRFEYLRARLPGARVALLHGQLRAEEKKAVMRAFSSGELDILVATSIIEVGLDVPNATLMIIEDASRFGMAQLHQLRGRVGRGSGESLCVLLSGHATPEGMERLSALASYSDGFKIAEMDLRQRGPGEICGVRQHGVTDFRVANLTRDRKLLEAARRDAELLLREDPRLENARQLRDAVTRRLGGALDLAGTA